MLLMAPSGVDKGCLQPEQLIVVDQDQQLIDGIGKPSAETALHIKIVDQTGAGAVLHTPFRFCNSDVALSPDVRTHHFARLGDAEGAAGRESS